MKAVRGLILISLLAAGCAPSARQIKATVQAGIAQTQMAALSAAPTAALPLPPPEHLPTVVAPPTQASPLSFGSSERLLLETVQCLPTGQTDCLRLAEGIYSASWKGEGLQKLIDKARLLSLSKNGKQALVARRGADGAVGATEELLLLNLSDSSQTQISPVFASDFTCDAAHCGALWSADGSKILFVANVKDISSNRIEKHVFQAAADGTQPIQVTKSGTGVSALFLYFNTDSERVVWQQDNGGVSGGVVSTRLDGTQQTELAGMINPAFSPGGGMSAYLKQTNPLGYQTAFFVAGVDASNEIQLYTPQTSEFVHNAIWATDGNRLVVDVSRCVPECSSKHYLWQVAAPSLVELPAQVGYAARPPVWSPDNRYVLYVSTQPRGLWAVDVQSAQAQPFLDALTLPEGTEVERVLVVP